MPESLPQRVLLVGADSARVAEFRAAADQSGASWEVQPAKGAVEALACLESGLVEFVVAPVWLANTNGVDFLDAVMARWPDTTRILLSDSTLAETAVRGLGKAHHHLLGVSEATTLLDLFQRIRTFRLKLSNPKLPALMSKMPQLPSPPEIYFQVLDEVRSTEASLERVGQLILQDPPLSAKVLQLANSAVFGLHLQVIHPMEAVAYVGLETTKALLLLAHTFSFFEEVHCPNFSLTSLQYHALTVARYAQKIAELEYASPELQSEAFTAGLLHDLGKLFLAANLPNEFSEVLTQSQQLGRSPFEVETALLGANHAEVGGFVLDTWHLPEPIVQAVTWHHCPLRATPSTDTFSPLGAVLAANALEHELRAEVAADPDASHPAIEYFKKLGWEKRWDQWRASCHQG